MAEQKKQTRQEFERNIILKAWKDPEFKKRLLKDPKKVFQEELSALDKGIKLPDNLNIKVVEEDPKTLYLVLPQNPQEAAGRELSDKELESVAGGTIAIVVTAAVAVTTAVTVNTHANANVQVNANIVR
jgi:hypothetical protein